MLDYLKRCWVEINVNNLAYNYNLIKAIIPSNTSIMGVVKGNAYGHGYKYTSIYLQSLGVSCFGVSNIEEAILLRKYGINIPIIVFGYTSPNYYHKLIEYNIIQSVFNMDYTQSLNSFAINNSIKLNCHLKIDTGMNRLGFNFSHNHIENIISVYKLNGINVTGIYSHFSCADLSNSESIHHTNFQAEMFNRLINSLKAKSINPGLTHIQNSGGIFNYRNFNYDIVRPGIALYGINTFSSDENLLKPVMKFKSVITMVKQVKKGEYLSYGNFQLNKDSKIATVCAGYADGYPRKLSNKSFVIVNGKLCKLVGSICMDQLMIDVSNVDVVNIGDEVTLFGNSNEICLSALKLSLDSDSFVYELISNISKRVTRLYFKDEKLIYVDKLI